MTTAQKGWRREERAARRAAVVVTTLLVALLSLGCVTSIGGRSPERGEGTWLRDELYFGGDIPGGGDVSDDDWARFVEREIAPRFPDGFTVLQGEGRWGGLDHSGPQSEASRIVVIVRPEDDESADEAIDALIEAYKRLFRQESVLRVTDRVEARF